MCVYVYIYIYVILQKQNQLFNKKSQHTQQVFFINQSILKNKAYNFCVIL
jgi:hypothetical protein